MPADNVVAVSAPAKINLYLHVTGRRVDGYHTLDSLVVFAGLGDSIRIAPAESGAGLSLHLTGEFAEDLRLAGAAGEGNLALRAVRLMAEASGKGEVDLSLTLEKNLPVAAGIGGGSADAAAAMRALARLWWTNGTRGPGMTRLRELGLMLGADVPACLERRPVFLSGIGDELEPTQALPALWAVLANPLRPLSTPQVFATRRGPFSEPATWTDEVSDAGELIRRLADRRNDLQDAAVALESAVGEVLQALSALPAARLARMSGSGGTCFALFDDEAAATTAAERLAAAQPGWWVRATSFAGLPCDGD